MIAYLDGHNKSCATLYEGLGLEEQKYNGISRMKLIIRKILKNHLVIYQD